VTSPQSCWFCGNSGGAEDPFHVLLHKPSAVDIVASRIGHSIPRCTKCRRAHGRAIKLAIILFVSIAGLLSILTIVGMMSSDSTPRGSGVMTGMLIGAIFAIPALAVAAAGYFGILKMAGTRPHRYFLRNPELRDWLNQGYALGPGKPAK
jgi:hypothetical protein